MQPNGTLYFTGRRSMPDNAGFYHVAYVVAIAIYVLYAFSLRKRIAGLRGTK
jgi:hypothetical protein